MNNSLAAKVWGKSKDLVGEPRQRAFRQGNNFHRHIDIHHRDGSVNRLLDVFQVMADMFALGYPVIVVDKPMAM